MFPTTLQRVILRELVLSFLTALLVCVALLMVVDIFDERWATCVDPVSFLRVLQWMILAMLPEAVPTALLFACCQVYGRMRRDQEWQAIQAGGVHPVHATMPVFVLAAILSAGIAALSYTALPSAEFLARKAVMKQGEALLYAKLRSSGRVAVPPYVIYVRKVNGRELIDPIVKRTNSNGQHDLVMQAQNGELTVDTTCGVLRMQGAAMLEPETRASMEKMTWEIPLPNCFGVYFPQTTREMTLTEILTRRDVVREQLRMLEEEGDPKLDATELEQKCEGLRRDIRWLDVEIQKRPAIAVGCLCFALLGCAAGIYAGFGDLLSAFVAVFLPICAGHKVLLLCGIQWAVRCASPPEVTVWLANMVVGAAGIALYCHVTRR